MREIQSGLLSPTSGRHGLSRHSGCFGLYHDLAGSDQNAKHLSTPNAPPYIPVDAILMITHSRLGEDTREATGGGPLRAFAHHPVQS